jgi:hypothetical protein
VPGPRFTAPIDQKVIRTTNGERVETPFYTVNYDFRLRPAGAAAPIKA